MNSPENSPSPTPLILDLDQHLHRQALLEAIQFLSILYSSLSTGQEQSRHLTRQALLRLTYLGIHLRTQSEIHSEIRSLHRMCQQDLARALEAQTSRSSLHLPRLTQ